MQPREARAQALALNLRTERLTCKAEETAERAKRSREAWAELVRAAERSIEDPGDDR